MTNSHYESMIQAKLDYELDVKFMTEIMGEIIAQAGGCDLSISVEYPCHIVAVIDGYEFTYGDGNTPDTKCWQTEFESGDDVPNSESAESHARKFWLDVMEWAQHGGVKR